MSHSTIDLAPYTETYHQLKRAIAGLSKDQLSWKAAPDKWSVTEVLSHLADHSIVFSFRVRKLISEQEVLLPTFEQDPWVLHSKANEGDAADYLDLFGAVVKFNYELFQRLTAEDWQKSGTNVQGQSVSVEQSYQAFIQHVQTHLRQIERIKLALSKS